MWDHSAFFRVSWFYSQKYIIANASEQYNSSEINKLTCTIHNNLIKY